MSHVYTSMSTGLPGLDKVLHGIIPGDTVIWQIDDIDDYEPFVYYFCKQAIIENRPVIYFRFAGHRELVHSAIPVKKIELNPENGFEPFLFTIFDTVDTYGIGACYVFDCVSHLSDSWYSDRILGNFIRLVCSYLNDFETNAYFAIFRNRHMTVAANAIAQSGQVILDIYNNGGSLYIHPIKVQKRHSQTMYQIHVWRGNDFLPVTNSAIIAEIVSRVSQPWLELTTIAMDRWTQNFQNAQHLSADRRPQLSSEEEHEAILNELLTMAVSKDPRFIKLGKTYFTIEDILNIGKRMIGTGLIGGKSAGMLLARAILQKHDQSWNKVLEVHDSFFIGSDVFYTYLVENGCWWTRRKIRKIEEFLDSAEDERQRILYGSFPRDIVEQFTDMLNYFGQSPIIVRSSSLLEDAYGNAFSGKYESVFCTNQGPPQHRLEQFMAAVRTVYASTLSKEALRYRQHWGLLDRDEQMSILVQRVSGQQYGSLYFPHVAGVGFSYNPFAWSSEVDPAAGMIRLVFGLGTRAVDRTDDDYTRIVALNAPLKRPENSIDEVRKYTQRKVDVLDLTANKHTSKYFEDVAAVMRDIDRLLEIFVAEDADLFSVEYRHPSQKALPVILSFDILLSETNLVKKVRTILEILQQAYQHPVDIEFTASFLSKENFRINLLQCRPFQAKSDHLLIKQPESIAPESIIFQTSGPIIGASCLQTIDRLLYIVPAFYSSLSMADRYTIARLIGRISQPQESEKKQLTTLLIGPGRWGTTTPALGVPVSFSEISAVSVICELAFMHEGLIPDVSLGTHFFNDLVENQMLYIAVFPDKREYLFNESLILGMSNSLSTLFPEIGVWEKVIQFIEFIDMKPVIFVDSVNQKGVCYTR
ncbi:MAG: hypothetical protein JW795_03530 [Chitinivibrionales bacterium]|nr:hypothetical protein [Chitinivibrionales bacterium]